MPDLTPTLNREPCLDVKVLTSGLIKLTLKKKRITIIIVNAANNDRTKIIKKFNELIADHSFFFGQSLI